MSVVLSLRVSRVLLALWHHLFLFVNTFFLNP